MVFFDEKFKSDKLRYLLQCFLAVVAVGIVLLVLDAVSNAAIIAALGASSFIAFTMPHVNVSKPRFMIGGYLVGIGTGCAFRVLMKQLSLTGGESALPYVLFGAVSVGFAIFVMVITNTEHPPAASLALGLVLNGCEPKVILFILIGIVSLTLIKWALKPVLKNLL